MTGTPKAYSIKGIPNLESGMSYTYKLKIGKDKAKQDNKYIKRLDELLENYWKQEKME